MKTTILIALLSFTLVACDGVMKQATEPAKPAPTAVSVNLEVLDLARQGKSIDALKLGEEFLRTGSDPEGVLHATMARIYADVGDTESSVRHLQKVGGNAGNGSMTVIVTREESTVAQQPAPQPAPAARPGVGAATAGASAVIGPNGIEVRAGDASASVRN